MKNILTQAFEKLKKNPGEWGFNLSYSPEGTWNEKTKILVLTINPKANQTRIIPESPFPDMHDFFRERNTFKIRKPVQGLFWELSNIYQPNESDEPLKKALEFASHNIAMASFVPWRSEKSGEITESQWDFAEREIWKPLFNIWEPELIIQIGRQPYNRLCSILSDSPTKYKEKNIRDYMPVNQGQKSENLKVRYGRYGKNNNIVTINLPHPNATGYKGYPTNFPENAQNISPIGKFLKDIL